MNAKTIIKTYSQTLNESENIAQLLNNYYFKKIREAGLIRRKDSSYLNSAVLILGQGKTYQQQKKRCQNYLKTLSTHFISKIKYTLLFAGELQIMLPEAIHPVWKIHPIFSLGVYASFPGITSRSVIQAYQNVDIVLELRDSVEFSEAKNTGLLTSFEEFSSDESLLNVYRLIDKIVKVVRLTPF